MLQANKSITYKANGKLLLTGEYLVIDGAAALALPVKYGQLLTCTLNNSAELSWTASDINGVWFKAKFSLPVLEIKESSDETIATTLKKILLAANSLNRSFLANEGMTIETHLDFDRLLGLGSSSTLIALVARISGVNEFKLHSMISSGSGYDVACAFYSYPILFQRKAPGHFMVKPLNFQPEFSDHIWFVYLGNKQDTDREISIYKQTDKETIRLAAAKISEITFKLPEVKDLSTFVSLITLHEQIISDVLGRKGVKESRFQTFKGCIKSLGAWGGDFIMAVSSESYEYVKNYFQDKGTDTIYRFNDLVLNEPVTDENEVNIRF